MSNHVPERHTGLPSGLFTALGCATLLTAAFVLATLGTPMPPSERWAALTTFVVLTLAYTLQGSPELYDVLGRTIRRDNRTLVPLLLLLPALYLSYSAAVDLFTWYGLLATCAFVGLPALAFARSGRQRTPTILDLVAALYLLISLSPHLLPALPLPQQGGQINFFHFSIAPLLLLLLAERGWPGLGFTWFISASDLRLALTTAAALLAILVPLVILDDIAQVRAHVPPTLDALRLAILLYFLVALPQEIFFRGFIQNGIERFAELKLWRGPGNLASTRLLDTLIHPRTIGLVCAALLSGLAYFNTPSLLQGDVLLTTIASLGYGWVYQRTGKVTASAITHMLVVWCWTFFFSRHPLIP